MMRAHALNFDSSLTRAESRSSWVARAANVRKMFVSNSVRGREISAVARAIYIRLSMFGIVQRLALSLPSR
jgi:hypothetical protein